jgi:hypothetical protein
VGTLSIDAMDFNLAFVDLLICSKSDRLKHCAADHGIDRAMSQTARTSEVAPRMVG